MSSKKVAIITGAGGNLGRAAVHTFLAKGFTVIGTLGPGKQLESDHPALSYHSVNLTEEATVQAFVQEVIQTHSRIDAAIFIAGGFAMGNIAATDSAAIQKMFQLNFMTAYPMCRAAFAQMQTQETGGNLIFIGSKPALEPESAKGVLPYALSKSLLFSLADYLNAEGQAQNIISSVVVPGIIDTAINRKSMPKADFSKWVSPDTIAELMVFICSDHAKDLRQPVYKIYGGI